MTDFHWTAAFVIAFLAAARITRLVTWDTYPPVARLRAWWDKHTDESDWNLLLHCGYCFGMYAALIPLVWGGLLIHFDGELHWTWWAFNGWLAISYLAAITMAYDGEES